MKADYSPRAQAQIDWRNGEGHASNPYARNDANREIYMLEMARLQAAEMQGLYNELRAGV